MPAATFALPCPSHSHPSPRPPPRHPPADVADIVGLQPTAAGVGRLGALYYALLARPSPIVGASRAVAGERSCGGSLGAAAAAWLL